MSLTHLHLMLNHVPVIGLIIGIGLLGLAIAMKKSDLAKASLGLFVILGITSIVVYLTGESAEEAVENVAGFSEAITERHEEFALVATVVIGMLAAMSFGVLALFRKKALPRWITLSSFVLALITSGFMGYTAMLGGQVRHTEIRPDVASTVSETDPD
jgi:uncharacterized membrane protein